VRGAGPQGDWGCQVNACENPYRCDWAEVCKDGTKYKSAKCLATREKCPACGVSYGKHLGLNGTCRDLRATKALLREALGLLERALDLRGEEARQWHEQRRNLLASAGKQGDERG